MNIGSVLLAAGGGSRFKAAGTLPGHKLTQVGADGRTVVEHAYQAMHRGTPLHRVRLVVSGAVELPDLPLGTVIYNEDWASGQSSSVWAALSVAENLDLDAVVIGLGDQPSIDPGAWEAVTHALREGAKIAVATYSGKRSNPVGLAREVWPLLPNDADEGARTVMRLHPHLVTEVACSGNPADIDSPEDLHRWHLS